MSACQEQRIDVEPFDAAFRLRQGEAVLHEAATGHVVFSEHAGIAAAARQAQHGPLMQRL